MKMPRQNTLIITALFVVAGLALAGLYYFGNHINDAPRGSQVTNPIFLQKIGAYGLVTADINLGDASCEDFVERPETPEIDPTGRICERTMGAEYKDPASGRVIFIHLIRITEGRELYMKLLSLSSRPDKLEPFDIIRLEGSEIGWFPAKDFDIIVSVEGDLTPTGFDYALKAEGINAVTQYFINTYRPVTK